MNDAAVVFNIQRFCLHDGPGVRTVIFFKGCPLHCLWCSNPESQNPQIELMYDRLACIECGYCLKTCPHHALFRGLQGITIDRTVCRACGSCCSVCPTQALRLSGRSMTISDLLPIVLADSRYFQISGGGVTFSGGEPTMAGEFLLSIAKYLGAEGIDRALETSGFCEPRQFLEIISSMDRILFDIKLLESRDHTQYTSKNNTLILDNFYQAVHDKPTTVRVPLIPTVNMTGNFYQSLVSLLHEYPVEGIDLLPYHAYGLGKYVQLERKGWQVDPSSHEELEIIKDWFQQYVSVPVRLVY